MCMTLVFAVGCSKTYRTDFLKRFTPFIDYSLGKGNWKLADTGKGEILYPDFAYFYTWWEIEFTDYQGETRVLYFDNAHNRNYEYAFASDIIYTAIYISGSRIRDALSHYTINETPYSETSDDPNTPPNPYNPDTAKPGIFLQMQANNSAFASSNTDATLSTTSGFRLYYFKTADMFPDYIESITIKGRFDDEQQYRRAVASLHDEVVAFLGKEVNLTIDIHLYSPGSEVAKESFLQTWSNGQVI